MFCCNASEAYLTPNSASTISQASSPLSRFRFKTLIPSNEIRRGNPAFEREASKNARHDSGCSGPLSRPMHQEECRRKSR